MAIVNRREFINVETIEKAKAILNEYFKLWDVIEHYDMLDLYCFLYKDTPVADWKYLEKKLYLS